MKQEFLSVSELNKIIKRVIDSEPLIQNVWLRAEISNFKHHSRGHMYFTLKDDRSKVNSVMFAGSNRFLKFRPENGMSVLVRGDISVYEPHGQYQLYVKEMQPDGIGNLYMAFEELKKKLDMAGYFSPQNKKPIPAVPKSIAVITSPTGAAVRDIITTIERRFPVAKIILLPVLVQGPGSASSVARAIYQANAAGNFDVIIAGRGGGSIEELWAFNEEIVAEAIYKSVIPVISAVGHETDITISDFVADLRAPTPTAAAEMAVPDIKELARSLEERKLRLVRGIQAVHNAGRDRLDYLARSYAFRYPKQLLEQKEQELDRLVESLRKSVSRTLEKKRTRQEELAGRIIRVHPANLIDQQKKKLEDLKINLSKSLNRLVQEKEKQFSVNISKLEVLSPLKMMDRGYSLVYNEENQLVKKVADAPEDTAISIRLQDGELTCKVTDREYKELPKVNRSENNGK
jgi:exodeoxyribonuclease VII large subunit